MKRITKALFEILEDNENQKLCLSCNSYVNCCGKEHKREKWCREYIETAFEREGSKGAKRDAISNEVYADQKRK